MAPDAAQDVRAAARRVTVVKIVDGDTFDVNPGKERVRPLTVDTPELHAYEQPPKPPQCGAVAARDALAGLMPVWSQMLLRQLPGEHATDGSDPPRTLSNVYVERDGQLINVSLWLVEQGWAVAFKSKSYRTADTDEAKLLMKEAQAAHRGMWAICPVRDVLPR